MNEKDIFCNALEIDEPKERTRYLDKVCHSDPKLRAKVETLLQLFGAATTLLEVPASMELGLVPPSANALPAIDQDDEKYAFNALRQFFNDSAEDEPPFIFQNFEIDSLLGIGTSGIVVKAFDTQLRRTVAIKFLRPELAVSSPPRKRFLREARAAAAFDDDHIVKIYSVHESPTPHLIMEYLKGKTLAQLVTETGPLDSRNILDIGHQLASGLAAAHASDLIHRDIKPANILLTGKDLDQIKITDFGLARAVDDASLTMSGIIAGSPMYMSPEQAGGESMDARADLFSLGSVLYFLTTGRPPFRSTTTVGTLQRVRDAKKRDISEIIPDCPQWLIAVINRLMNRDPQKRFASAAQLADLLQTYDSEIKNLGRVKSYIPGESEPSDATRSPREDVVESFGLNQVLVFAVAMALTITASVLTYWLLHSQNKIPSAPNFPSQNSASRSAVEPQTPSDDMAQRESITCSPMETLMAVYHVQADGLGYWTPLAPGQWGIITYKIELPFEVGKITNVPNLAEYAFAPHVPFLNIYNQHTDANFDSSSHGVIEVSTDGEAWHPIFSISPENGREEFPSMNTHVSGHQSFYLRARLRADESTAAAQFLRGSMPPYVTALHIKSKDTTQFVAVSFKP